MEQKEKKGENGLKAYAPPNLLMSQKFPNSACLGGLISKPLYKLQKKKKKKTKLKLLQGLK